MQDAKDERAEWQRDMTQESDNNSETSKNQRCDCADSVDGIPVINTDRTGNSHHPHEVRMEEVVDVADATANGIDRYAAFADLIEDVFSLSVQKNIEYGDAITKQAQERADDPAYANDDVAYHVVDMVLTRTGDKRSRIVEAIEGDGPNELTDVEGDIRETASYWLWAALAVQEAREQTFPDA